MIDCRRGDFYGGDHSKNFVYCAFFKDIQPVGRARSCPSFRRREEDDAGRFLLRRRARHRFDPNAGLRPWGW